MSALDLFSGRVVASAPGATPEAVASVLRERLGLAPVGGLTWAGDPPPEADLWCGGSGTVAAVVMGEAVALLSVMESGTVVATVWGTAWMQADDRLAGVRVVYKDPDGARFEGWDVDTHPKALGLRMGLTRWDREIVQGAVGSFSAVVGLFRVVARRRAGLEPASWWHVNVAVYGAAVVVWLFVGADLLSDPRHGRPEAWLFFVGLTWFVEWASTSRGRWGRLGATALASVAAALSGSQTAWLGGVAMVWSFAMLSSLGPPPRALPSPEPRVERIG